MNFVKFLITPFLQMEMEKSDGESLPKRDLPEDTVNWKFFKQKLSLITLMILPYVYMQQLFLV